MVLASPHSYNALLMNTITKTSHQWSHWDALNNSSFTYSVHSWFFKQSSQPCSNLKTTTPSAMANHCQEKRLAASTWIFQSKTSKNTARITSAQLTIIVQHCLEHLFTSTSMLKNKNKRRKTRRSLIFQELFILQFHSAWDSHSKLCLTWDCQIILDRYLLSFNFTKTCLNHFHISKQLLAKWNHL